MGITDGHDATESQGKPATKLNAPDIGVALSGGGFRASLHAIGALMYLVDAELNKRVTSIVSVSGGSITNGFIAANCNFRRIDRDQFDKLAAQLIDVITRQGFIWSWPVKMYFLLVLILAGISFLGLLSTWIGFWPFGLSWTIFLAGSGTLFSLLLLRGHLLSLLLKKRIFSNSNVSVTESNDEVQIDESNTLKSFSKGPFGLRYKRLFGLRQVQKNEEIEHGFSATDLNHGAPVFFITTDGGKIYSQALKQWSSFPVFEKLHEVVRASAAFPGGFPPKRLHVPDFRRGRRVRSFRWRLEGQHGIEAEELATLFLADGGVWNNLGTDLWPDYWIDTKKGRWRESGTLSKTAYLKSERPAAIPEQRLVVNSGVPLSLLPSRWLVIPVLAEFIAVLRTMETLYQNTVAPRVREMQRRSKMLKSVAKKTGPPQTVVVDISSNPLEFVWKEGRQKGAPSDAEFIQRRERSWNLLIKLLISVAPEVQQDKKFRDLLEARKSRHITRRFGDFDFYHPLRLATSFFEGATQVARSVPTTLDKIDARSATALIIHGYVSAMAGMHTLYGEPLVQVPTSAELRDRVQLDEYHSPLELAQKSDVIRWLNEFVDTKPIG